jgi:hypothetical protein
MTIQIVGRLSSAASGGVETVGRGAVGIAHRLPLAAPCAIRTLTES